MRTQANCSYNWNFIKRGADSVVANASDWNAGAPGWLPGRSRPDVFGITANGHRLTSLNCAAGRAQCYTPCTLKCLVSYIKSSPLSHSQLYHDTPVVLCVYLMANYFNALQTSKESRKRRKKTPPPSSLRSPMPPSWNLTSYERRWRVCCIVVTSL